MGSRKSQVLQVIFWSYVIDFVYSFLYQVSPLASDTPMSGLTTLEFGASTLLQVVVLGFIYRRYFGFNIEALKYGLLAFCVIKFSALGLLSMVMLQRLSLYLNTRDILIDYNYWMSNDLHYVVLSGFVLGSIVWLSRSRLKAQGLSILYRGGILYAGALTLVLVGISLYGALTAFLKGISIYRPEVLVSVFMQFGGGFILNLLLLVIAFYSLGLRSFKFSTGSLRELVGYYLVVYFGMRLILKLNAGVFVVLRRITDSSTLLDFFSFSITDLIISSLLLFIGLICIKKVGSPKAQS